MYRFQPKNLIRLQRVAFAIILDFAKQKCVPLAFYII